MAQLEHGDQLFAGLISQRVIGLVDNQHVGYFEDTGLDGLNVVAQTRRTNYDAHVSDLCNLHLGLSGTHRLDDDHLPPGGVQQIDDLGGGRRQSAKVTAG